METLLLITIFFGIAAAVFPAYWAIWFWNRGGDLIGKRLSFMLVGESVSMFIAVWFTINSYNGVYNDASPGAVMLLRWVLFSTALISTTMLVSYLRKKQDSRDRRQTDGKK